MAFVPPIPLINGVSYSWAQIQLVISGVPFTGITKITYKEKQNKKNNYGIGLLPVSRGYGNIEFEGSIEMYQETLQQIRAISPFGKIASLPPFPINVLFENPTNPSIHTLLAVEFLNDDFDATQGDTEEKATINIIIGDITRI